MMWLVKLFTYKILHIATSMLREIDIKLIGTCTYGRGAPQIVVLKED